MFDIARSGVHLIKKFPRKAIAWFPKILASVVATFSLVQDAEALGQRDLSATQKIWSYTKQLDSVEGYKAFISAHTGDAQLTLEAKARAINLLGDYSFEELDLIASVTKSTTFGDSGGPSYRTAALGDLPEEAGTFEPPIGERRWTFPKVFVDDLGRLVDETGDFISPTGGVVVDRSFQVTTDGRLLEPNGNTVALDVGIKPLDEEVDQERTVLGRLSVDGELNQATPAVNGSSSTGDETQTFPPRLIVQDEAITRGLIATGIVGSYAG